MDKPDIIYPDEKDNIENITFYYDRSERLKNDPKEVQDYYSGKWIGPPKGLFKALVHTKSSRFIFATLCFVLAISILMMMINSKENIITFENVKVELSAFSFEDTIFISIKTENKNENPIDANVVINVLDKDFNIINTKEQKIKFDLRENFFRTTFTDYDIIYSEATVTLSGQTKTAKCSVLKK